MSLQTIKPEVLAIAAGELTRPTSQVSSTNTVTTEPTTGAVRATSCAASVLTAAQFNGPARKHRAVGAHGAAVVHHVCAAGLGPYATTKTANAWAVRYEQSEV